MNLPYWTASVKKTMELCIAIGPILVTPLEFITISWAVRPDVEESQIHL